MPVVIAVAALCMCGLAPSTNPSKQRPNIIVFLGEGLRFDEFSSAGNKILSTPNMDRIGREGFVFENAFVVNALCLPSRATILTGLYSHTTGAVSNVEGTIPSQIKLVSDLLQEHGYETAFIGKSHIKGALKNHYWDYYFGFAGQADYYRPVLTEGVRGQYGDPKEYSGKYVDDLLTQKAVEWLRQKHEKPFCLFLWFYAPHAPFYRPKRMVNLFNGVPIPEPTGEVVGQELLLRLTVVDNYDIQGRIDREVQQINWALTHLREKDAYFSQELGAVLAQAVANRKRAMESRSSISARLNIPQRQATPQATPTSAPPAQTAPIKKPAPQKQGEKWDVFISHASEDKPYVEPLAKALEAAGVSVWYDRLVLEWGDDLRPMIDDGLVNCR